MFNIVILGLVSLLTDISSEMVYPILPLFLTGALGAGPAVIGLIEGVAESLASLLKVFSGYAGDRTQKKKQLAIAGYSFSSISKVILLSALSWWWVLAARIVDRFGKGVRTAPRDALIAEASRSGSRGKAFGLHRALDTLGAVVGVVLAYFLVSASPGKYQMIFLLSLIPAFLGVGMLFLVRQSGGSGSRSGRPSLKWSRLDTRLKKFLLVSFFFTLGNSSNQFLLLRAQNAGFDVRTVILLYLVYNVVYGIFSYPAGHLSDLVGRRRVLVAGYGFYALVYFGFGTVSGKGLFWLLFALYGIYTAMTEGVSKALIADISPGDVRGTVLGLYATVVGAGLLPASLLAGLLWNWFGPRAPFIFGGAMGLGAAVGTWMVLKARVNPSTI